jgi:hypothetical protein
MIAQVAGENGDRGRVVVRLGSFEVPSAAALAAAVHVARAFQSEVEGVFVEDPDLFLAASHGFVREVGHFAGRVRPLSPTVTASDTAHFAVAAQRDLATIAAAHRVRFEARAVREQAVPALARACAERGPWNIVAFGEPIADAEAAERVADALREVAGATGYVVAGRRAGWRRGPVVVAVEDVDRLPGQLRVARGLAAVDRDPVWLVPVASDVIGKDWLEAELRMVEADLADVVVRPAIDAGAVGHALPTTLTAAEPRLVIARNGGLSAPADALPRVLLALDCPVFLTH